MPPHLGCVRTRFADSLTFPRTPVSLDYVPDGTDMPIPNGVRNKPRFMKEVQYGPILYVFSETCMPDGGIMTTIGNFTLMEPCNKPPLEISKKGR